MNGQELKRIRLKLKLEQTELGYALGYGDYGGTYISKLENGARAIPPLVARVMFLLDKRGWVPSQFYEREYVD